MRRYAILTIEHTLLTIGDCLGHLVRVRASAEIAKPRKHNRNRRSRRGFCAARNARDAMPRLPLVPKTP